MPTKPLKWVILLGVSLEEVVMTLFNSFIRRPVAMSVPVYLAFSAAVVSQTTAASDITIIAPITADQGEQVAPTPEPLVLTGDAALLRDALEAGGEKTAELRAFYETRAFEPIWNAGRISALVDVLAAAADHGLPAARYAGAELGQLFATNPIGADKISAEIAASEEFLKYAHDVGSGLTVPNSIDRELNIFPERTPVAVLLAGMSEADNLSAFLAGLAPSHPHYKSLQAEKLRLETLISDAAWGPEIPAGGTLKPGASGARVTAMRARLAAIEGLELGEEPVFDAALVEVVKTFQLRHGLNDDGVAGPRTLAAINATPEDRLKQVLVNLERQRWLNLDRGERHIYVNQADFTVTLFEKGEPIYFTRAVVGKAVKHRTPEFNDEMTHMVVNPTWHVPRSIATEEMLPKLQRNPGALGNMSIQTRNGTRVNPALVDFSQFTKGNFPFVIKEPPSGGNALGRVKFLFPNKFNIYLHDTPSKSLFNRDARAFSHGCVRLQKPFELAEILLGFQTSDPAGTFQSYLNTGRERRVDLEQAIPVYLTYQSAWVDNFGKPQFREDIYGRDKKVFDALEAAGVSLNAVEG